MKYCVSSYQTIRRKTREVMVGKVGVGGDHPIRIQSMTTSSTRNVEATVDQIMRLADAGCEIARVTVQGMKEAEACEQIKNELVRRGYLIPLVADIHFFPPAAMKVADFVDKIRINPGNYVDKRASFKIIEYDDATYAAEIEKIEEKFTPLVEKCKRLKKAIRIGTNHGSLSDRIMNRYGDTPFGMVESALEFTRICRKNDFHDLIFSMKASNPLVMIQAYRLLVAEMEKLNWNYPLHLGVTEAGEGEDGRIKSAMGMGALLLDGIGDTIRVSLTEDPWNEIDPCRRLVRLAEEAQGQGVSPFEETHRNIQEVKKRAVSFPKSVPMHRNGTVMVNVDAELLQQPDFYQLIGCEKQLGTIKLKSTTADMIVLKHAEREERKLQILSTLLKKGVGVASFHPLTDALYIQPLQAAIESFQKQQQTARFALSRTTRPQPLAILVEKESEEEWNWIHELKPEILIFSPKNHKLHAARHFFEWLQNAKISSPVILHFTYLLDKEDLIIQAAAEYGALLCDGYGEGIWIEAPHEPDFMRQLSFNILQAARMRSSKTDFISCPSCGRTLFDLQEVSRSIRNRTAHLPGVKIAIMGCIVNGPGEMADADFGYVGSKPGMIDLYLGKQCVEKDIPFSEAVDRLVALIKQHGRWVEPEELEMASCPSE
ncbi:(E)-4-hydroxy-3-methylbut-2-enyl-diphosphate synthase [Parachlamydia sp. AcF125]|uniref:(E)-4-hydroxy-3-methylbut-2-enyl-diphosphate synthase n=1 Tax=Parachlamydia sp. AcF125 TaxID=2795736 RepID=UPI001BC8F948|nr:(E)-4-hydroxy-3-methylbut-2-enyl-diphosphate synthase [Parachlamydia sp. AcF125]MBS4167398.1 4-hydroxy-3-methylbut-2-en-1-yl diphosphate synthase (ferredoxin) [Parachlamydia sp. AcF125]